MSRRSHWLSSSSITLTARFDARSSAGFGASGPDATRPIGRSPRTGWIASDAGASPSNIEVNPTRFVSPKNSCTRGRRRSQHKTMTRWPTRAKVTARFASVVVLPSPAIALVTCTLPIGWSRLRNSTAVRTVR